PSTILACRSCHHDPGPCPAGPEEIGGRDDEPPMLALRPGARTHGGEPTGPCAGGKDAAARMPDRAAIHVRLFRVPEFGLVQALVWHLQGIHLRNFFCWTAGQAVLPAARG